MIQTSVLSVFRQILSTLQLNWTKKAKWDSVLSSPKSFQITVKVNNLTNWMWRKKIIKKKRERKIFHHQTSLAF